MDYLKYFFMSEEASQALNYIAVVAASIVLVACIVSVIDTINEESSVEDVALSLTNANEGLY